MNAQELLTEIENIQRELATNIKELQHLEAIKELPFRAYIKADCVDGYTYFKESDYSVYKMMVSIMIENRKQRIEEIKIKVSSIGSI